MGWISGVLYPLGRKEEDYYKIALETWNAVQKTSSSDEYDAHDFPWPYADAKYLAEQSVLQKAAEHNKMNKVQIIRPSAGRQVPILPVSQP